MSNINKKDSINIEKELDLPNQNSTEVYDLIHSEDLEKLYKKNAQLLSRLSTTGRENGILQTEVCSLIEEKSKLDINNNFLKTKVDGLKSQISLFARQQKTFNQQSVKLKRELEDLKIQGINLVDERKHIRQDQSQLIAKKLIHYMKYRNRVKKSHKQLKSHYEELQNKHLHLLQKEQFYSKSIKNYEEQIEEFKQHSSQKEEIDRQILLLTKREQVHIQQIQSLKNQYLEANQSKDLQEEDLEKTKKLNAELQSQIESQNNSLSKESDLHKLIETFKIQQEDLLKENASYENQINFYQSYEEENKALSENYNQLRSVLSQQQEGFNQTLMSFRKQYIATQKELSLKTEELEEANQEVKNLILQTQEDNSVTADEINALKLEWESQALSENKSLTLQLESKIEHIKEIETKLNKVEASQQLAFSNQHKEYSDEIKHLKLRLETQETHFKEDEERSLQTLKNEYENRILGLKTSYDTKLKHIQTEMENDLLSEKRRSEVFKSMKEKKVNELESQLHQVQPEVHKLQTSLFALETSNKNTMAQLKKEISKNEELSYQNKNIHSLWQDLQQSVEKKEQQIQSLQQLNKKISQSLNEHQASKNNQAPPSYYLNESPTKDLNFKEEKISNKETPQSTKDILTEIHFD